jgi:hypothetical protein
MSQEIDWPDIAERSGIPAEELQGAERGIRTACGHSVLWPSATLSC